MANFGEVHSAGAKTSRVPARLSRNASAFVASYRHLCLSSVHSTACRVATLPKHFQSECNPQEEEARRIEETCGVGAVYLCLTALLSVCADPRSQPARRPCDNTCRSHVSRHIITRILVISIPKSAHKHRAFASVSRLPRAHIVQKDCRRLVSGANSLCSHIASSSTHALM